LDKIKKYSLQQISIFYINSKNLQIIHQFLKNIKLISKKPPGNPHMISVDIVIFGTFSINISQQYSNSSTVYSLNIFSSTVLLPD